MSDKVKHTLDPNKWISQYADYLYNYAITRVDGQEIAKDLVQETFFSGIKGKDNYRGEAAELTWLVSILKRKIIDHYRKINSNKGKAEVRITYNSDAESEGDWLEERVAELGLVFFVAAPPVVASVDELEKIAAERHLYDFAEFAGLHVFG